MNKNSTNIIRSSSVEYLTFIAATGNGGINAIYENENIWLSQKMMAELYQVNVRTINDHLQKILVWFQYSQTSHIPERRHKFYFISLIQYIISAESYRIE